MKVGLAGGTALPACLERWSWDGACASFSFLLYWRQLALE